MLTQAGVSAAVAILLAGCMSAADFGQPEGFNGGNLGHWHCHTAGLKYGTPEFADCYLRYADRKAFEGAARRAAIRPPSPNIRSRTIIGPNGEMIVCHDLGSTVHCY